jgi:hypothetical protein
VLQGLAGLTKWPTTEFTQTLPYFEKTLSNLSHLAGYERLGRVIKSAVDWEGYNEVLTQVAVTLWFQQKGLAKEIEPMVMRGSTDILISFLSQDIYCEVASFQSILQSIISEGQDTEVRRQTKLQELMTEHPLMTVGDAEDEIDIQGFVSKLCAKVRMQLPSTYPGILVLDVSKSMILDHQIREIATRLFTKYPDLMLTMGWEWVGNEPGGQPRGWFVNSSSQWQNIALALLKSLGQDNQVTVI